MWCTSPFRRFVDATCNIILEQPSLPELRPSELLTLCFSICGEMLNDRKMTTHRREKHGEVTFQCPVCGQICKDKSRYVHLGSTIPQSDRTVAKLFFCAPLPNTFCFLVCNQGLVRMKFAAKPFQDLAKFSRQHRLARHVSMLESALV